MTIRLLGCTWQKLYQGASWKLSSTDSIRGLIITSVEAAILDLNAEYLGVSALQLMENAGRAVADVITGRFGRGSSVSVFGGIGRNGGDGMVTARHLTGRGFKVSFRLIGDSRTIRDPIVLDNWLVMKSMPSILLEELHDSTAVSKCNSDVLVDALMGTGVRGKLRQPTLAAVGAINESAGFKVAVDVPTGVDSDSGEILGAAVHANLTVTFHAEKPCLAKARSLCGEVFIADIGIPPEAALFAGPGDVKAVSRQGPTDSHEGQNRRLLIIGGSEIFTRAPSLAGLAAYRAGTNLVFVAAPEKAAQAVSATFPNLITVKLPGDSFTPSHIPFLQEQIEKADAIAVGPGLERSNGMARAVNRLIPLIRQMRKPLLLDAEAIRALKRVKKGMFFGGIVLTPHADEFQSLSGVGPGRDLKAQAAEVKSAAAKCGGIVLLKGSTDVISDGERLKFNSAGNLGNSVAGTGDVLAGLVAGLMAQGVDPFKAAVAGAFVSGAAGDLAEDQLGHHLVPTDILRFIPTVMLDPMCHKLILRKRLL